MNLTIYRGTNEIGGNCIEISCDKTRILFDFGIPLSAMDDKETNIIKYTPKIDGLYKDSESKFQAVFLSHAHPDHYGLLQTIHPNIPIYVTQVTYEILKNIAPLTTKNLGTENLKIISLPITIGNFVITPYTIDHSINGACAYEINCNNKTIVYTGDLRFHGRCRFNTLNFQKKLKTKSVDYLIMEGTSLNRTEQKQVKEDDLIDKFTEEFKNPNKLNIVCLSSLNFDRLITVFKATLKTKKVLVIDPYTYYILDIYHNKYPNIPYNSDKIKVYFVKNSITDALAEKNILFKYKKKKISIEEIIKEPSKYVIKGNYGINDKIFHEMKKEQLNIIFSMWSGYINKSEQLLPYKDIIKHIHTSGHAYVKDLQKFVNCVKPKQIIPIHTENKKEYSNLFNAKITLLDDNETLTI